MTDSQSQARWMWIAGVVLVGAVLRGIAVTDGFWMDEIWNWAWLHAPSIYAGETASFVVESWVDVFTKLRHDNNHQLVSLWILIVGDLDAWVVYRLPSLVAGLVALVLVADRADGWRGAAFGGSLFATSFLMIVYSTEARGYAMAACFALAAHRLLANREASGFELSGRAMLGFAGLVVLGLSAHFVFVHFLVGAWLWTGWGVVRRCGWGEALRRLAWIHALPGVYLAWLYLTHIRVLVFGGAASAGVGQSLQELFAWLAGLPNAPYGAVAGGVVLLVLAGAGIAARPERIGLLLGVVLLGPALPVVAALLRGDDPFAILYVRYFTLAGVFLLLYAGQGLVALHRRGGGRATFALAACAVLVGGNLVRTVRFFDGGRGQYLAAVEFMRDRSLDASGRPTTFGVGSDAATEFRSKLVMLYYRRFLHPGQQAVWVDGAERQPPERTPNWFLLAHPWYPEMPAAAQPRFGDHIRLPNGVPFQKAGEYSHYGPSGFSWVLFGRRQ